MQITVLIEAVSGKGYHARGGEPLALSAEGTTRDEALKRLQELMTERLREGAQIVSLEVPEISAPPHPWMSFAGTLRDDPLFDSWQEAIQEYRRQMEETSDAL